MTEKLVAVHLYNTNALFKWFVKEGFTDRSRHQIILLQGMILYVPSDYSG